MVPVLELGSPIGARLEEEGETVDGKLIGGLGIALRLGSKIMRGRGLGPELGT